MKLTNFFCKLLIEVLHNITLPLQKALIDELLFFSVLVAFVLMHQYNSIVKGDEAEKKRNLVRFRRFHPIYFVLYLIHTLHKIEHKIIELEGLCLVQPPA